MTQERELTKLAALFAAGLILEDELLEMLGDENLVNQVISMSGATVAVGATKGLIEDGVDTAFDVVDSVNPFKDWL